jgi:hypothetical protein
MDVGSRAEKPLGYRTEFAVVSDNYSSLGVLDQMAQYLGLMWMHAREPVPGVDAIDPDEHDVGEHGLSRVVGKRANEGEPVAAQLPSGYHNVNPFA